MAQNPGPPSSALVEQARASVDVILSHSQLNDLWEESANHEAWLAEVRGLRSRLG